MKTRESDDPGTGVSSFKLNLPSFNTPPPALPCKDASANKPPMLKVVKSSYHRDWICASNLFLSESREASDSKPPMLISLDDRKIRCEDDSFSSFVLGLLILPNKDASESRWPMLISDINPIGCMLNLFAESRSDLLVDIADRRPPMLKLVKLSSQGTDVCVGISVASLS
ncbi:hypothetical protein OROHE_024295 [Orobanche hederae]